MTELTEIDPDTLLDIIAAEGLIPREGLSLQSNLTEIGIPSLEMINILFAIEDRFGVVIETEDVQNAVTIQDMLDVVTKRLKTPAKPD